MEKEGFSWWIRRIKRAQDLFDEFRIDHFRGFSGFWAVPAGEIRCYFVELTNANLDVVTVCFLLPLCRS